MFPICGSISLTFILGTVGLQIVPISSTDYHLFLAAEKIAQIPARGRGWMRYIRLHGASIIVGWGCKCPPPPPGADPGGGGQGWLYLKV